MVVRIFLIGENGVGKSSLIRTFAKNNFSVNLKPTTKMEEYDLQMEVNEIAMKFKVFDTPGGKVRGLEDVRFETGPSWFVLVFDVTVEETFNMTKLFFIHLTEIKPEFRFLVLGNKIDDVQSRSVSYLTAKNWCDKKNLPYLETNANDLSTVKVLFHLIASQTYQNERVDMKVQTPWYSNFVNNIFKRRFSVSSSEPSDDIWTVMMPDNSEKLDLNILLLSEESVGKSTLVWQYSYKEFHREFFHTIGVEISQVLMKIEDKTISIAFWDPTSAISFRPLLRSYYKYGKDCCILVFDVTSRKSLFHLENVLNDFIQKTNLSNEDACSLVVLGNKTDCVEERQVSTEEALQWCQSHGALPYYETSAKYYINMDNVFKQIVRNTLKRKGLSFKEETELQINLISFSY